MLNKITSTNLNKNLSFTSNQDNKKKELSKDDAKLLADTFLIACPTYLATSAAENFAKSNSNNLKGLSKKLNNHFNKEGAIAIIATATAIVTSLIIGYVNKKNNSET